MQRRVVLEELSRRKDHPTAEQIFHAVSEKLPEISRTTVYRVLHTFVRLGIARMVSHPGAATRFETWTHRHHHLVCTRCDAILDLEDTSLDRLRLPETANSFTIEDYSIEFLGVCSRCVRMSSEQNEKTSEARPAAPRRK